MRSVRVVLMATLLAAALSGCAPTTLPERDPAPVGIKENPQEEARRERVDVCGEAVMINSIVNDADYHYAVAGSISADDWLAELLDAKAQAGRLAERNADQPYALAVREFAAMVSDFSETTPAQRPDRNWERAALFVQMCEDAGGAYGVWDDPGAVGG